MNEFQAFKIRNADGLFSTGGTFPKFKKTGKLWASLNHVHSHITMFAMNVSPFHEDNLKYLDCEVVNIVTGETIEYVYHHLCRRDENGYTQEHKIGWQQVLEKYKEKLENSK